MVTSKTISTVNLVAISFCTNCQVFGLGGGEGGGGKERLFSVMPEIFYQLLWRQGGQVVWIPHLKSGGPGNKPSLAVSQLRPASGQLGFYTP